MSIGLKETKAETEARRTKRAEFLKSAENEVYIWLEKHEDDLTRLVMLKQLRIAFPFQSSHLAMLDAEIDRQLKKD